MVSVAAGDHDSDEEEKSEPSSLTLRPLPEYVPFRWHIDGGRTSITVRPLHRDDLTDFYSTVKDAASSGSGYGLDELDGLNYFTRWYTTPCFKQESRAIAKMTARCALCMSALKVFECA